MGRAERAHGCSTTSRTATSSSTAGARRAFSPSTARRASASSCSACRRPTGWPGGVSASRSGTQSSFAASSLLQDHAFAGIFRPIQEAGIAALTGPQDSVEERRATYERRRDRALAALAGIEAAIGGHLLRLVPAARTVIDGRSPARGASRRGRAGRRLRRTRRRLGTALARGQRRAARSRARAATRGVRLITRRRSRLRDLRLRRPRPTTISVASDLVLDPVLVLQQVGVGLRQRRLESGR